MDILLQRKRTMIIITGSTQTAVMIMIMDINHISISSSNMIIIHTRSTAATTIIILPLLLLRMDRTAITRMILIRTITAVTMNPLIQTTRTSQVTNSRLIVGLTHCTVFPQEFTCTS